MRNLGRMYRESAVRAASPLGLIVILYEEVVICIRRAQRALQENNIEQRTLEISHAIRIIGHLQAVLDFEAGGQVARNLSKFYDTARTKALEANMQADNEILEWLATEFTEHGLAWKRVEQTEVHSFSEITAA